MAPMRCACSRARSGTAAARCRGRRRRGRATARVDPLFAWAALDCPSSTPVHGTIEAPVVLGRFTVALEGPIEVGAAHVIQSWLERTDGRKRHTAVAIFTASGERRAVGRAVWVELARPLGT